MKLAELISGSDIRGTAVGAAADLTPETARITARAFAGFLRNKTGKDRLIIALGHDSRISANKLKEGIIDGLRTENVTILDCGLMSTPSMFMMTQYGETDADGSIMITASHHPYDKNGFKFFTKSGGLEHEDLSRLVQFSEGLRPVGKDNYSLIKKDFLSLYCEQIKKMIIDGIGSNMPLSGLKIVVDAGNGAGGFYAGRILAPLGADVSGSQFLDPDGMFPNHIPNPEDAGAMRSIAEKVIKEKADFGIIFDTDVDRSAVVDSDGREYNRNRLIALISAIILKERSGAAIVTDSITSDGLAEFIEKCGGRHHRFRRGYRNVINEAVRLNGEGVYTPVAIETSGHCALTENYFLDDGAYLATRLLIELARLKKEGMDLGSLIEDLREPEESAEFRIKFKTEDWKNYGQDVIKNLFDDFRGVFKIAPVNHEGIRANFDGGWLLLRMSVHDPNMPVNIESDAAGGVKNATKILYGILKKYSGLDLAALEKYL